MSKGLKVHCTELNTLNVHMSKELKASSIYTVGPNTKYLNYIEHRIKCSNYNRIRSRPLNYNKLRIKTSNYTYFELDPS